MECDERAERNIKAYWYRLGPGWRDRPVIKVELRDSDLLQPLEAIDPRIVIRGPKHPVYGHLLGAIQQTSIDRRRACKLICRKASPRQRRAATTADLVDAGEHRMTIDRHGRLHSIITRMPRRLRRTLQAEGKPLAEIDISCCQPLLIGLKATTKEGPTTEQHAREPKTNSDPHPDEQQRGSEERRHPPHPRRRVPLSPWVAQFCTYRPD
jgi:hypothetical protein